MPRYHVNGFWERQLWVEFSEGRPDCAGGATVGVLELAAQGAATGLSADVVIGVGAVAGAALLLVECNLYSDFLALCSVDDFQIWKY